jgi:Protein of unknown function (DUF4019)
MPDSFFPRPPAPDPRPLVLALCLSAAALVAACGVGERRPGLPSGAQAAIDRLTEHFAERRFADIYAEAADEWRSAATAEQSRQVLERARERLGRVVNRATVRAAEQGAAGTASHTLSVSYNTKFERADAIEQITLVERDGRWLLARYSVSSDALK